jgi:hypothetical protein
MIIPSNEMTDDELAAARSKARQIAADIITGAALEIREFAYELVIINPRDPDKGRVHINYATGQVSWERTVWDHWGNLQGYPDDTDGTKAPVGERLILGALSALKQV